MTTPDRQRRVVAEVAAGVIAVSTPANTALPAITGTPNVGQALTCSRGTWTGGSLTYAYQWSRGGTPISGATAASYTPTATGSHSCAVTATNAKGSASAAASAVTVS